MSFQKRYEWAIWNEVRRERERERGGGREKKEGKEGGNFFIWVWVA